ncbi:hypothetical protein FB567DRAFT_603686 [Paraphoma chrysanthemicola]|uniref:Uncharacterized protein n=1 Tax=Paraphoma chrysanthemicola TaxID=798071 RepID=A0A8K0VXE7_9PLEO|nr:hypothetical protein FB567DRAFT_603686 [Paraphoma chrysanthemicola]
MAPKKQASTVLIAKGASWPRDQNAFSLLTIPLEILNAIYECAFVRDEMVVVDKEEHGKPDEFDPEYVFFNPRGENDCPVAQEYRLADPTCQRYPHRHYVGVHKRMRVACENFLNRISGQNNVATTMAADLHQVHIHNRNLNTGDVSVPSSTFRSRYWQPSSYRREFAVDHHQQKIIWNTAQPTAPLDCLSPKEFDLIFKYIAYEPEGTLFDLDHRQIFNNPLPYYAIDRSTRVMIQSRLQATREVVVRTRVRDSRAGGIDIASLRLWLEGPGEALFPRDCLLWILFNDPPPVIELILEPADAEKLPRDFFANITDLVLWTTHMPDHFIIRLTNAIKTKTDDENAGDFKIHTVLLKTLRQKYFLMLSYAMIACVSKRYDYEPEIWVNGEGKIFETSHLPPSSADSDTVPELRVGALEDLSDEEIIGKGVHLVDRIREIELARRVAFEGADPEEEKSSFDMDANENEGLGR